MITMTSPDLLDLLRDLKPHLLKTFRARELRLFGSSVRGSLHAGSDIGILVDFEEDADLFDLAGMAIFSEEALHRKVDVGPRRGLRDELRESVLDEAIEVNCERLAAEFQGYADGHGTY